MVGTKSRAHPTMVGTFFHGNRLINHYLIYTLSIIDFDSDPDSDKLAETKIKA
jgi:hypothetical protein